jgi:chromosome segregation ATPase
MPKDVAAHNAVYQKNRDEYAHAKIMIDALTPAYYAAADVMKYQNYKELNEDGELVDATVTGDTVEKLIAAYEQARKDYKKKLEGYIANLDDDIKGYRDAIKDLEKGVPEAQVKIDELEADIEKAKIELNALEEIAKGAKENLNRILEYVMSLDVNFVIPDFID